MTRNPRRKRVLGEHFRGDGKPKAGYATRRAAQEWLRARGTKGTVYHCTFPGCDHWHVASPKGCDSC